MGAVFPNPSPTRASGEADAGANAMWSILASLIGARRSWSMGNRRACALGSSCPRPGWRARRRSRRPRQRRPLRRDGGQPWSGRGLRFESGAGLSQKPCVYRAFCLSRLEHKLRTMCPKWQLLAHSRVKNVSRTADAYARSVSRALWAWRRDSGTSALPRKQARVQHRRGRLLLVQGDSAGPGSRHTRLAVESSGQDMRAFGVRSYPPHRLRDTPRTMPGESTTPDVVWR